MNERDLAIEDGRYFMRVWRNWAAESRERGWTAHDSIERASYQARTATELNGIARWQGKGTPPHMPKETKRQPGSTIPHDIDRAKLGPQTDRIIKMLRDNGLNLTVEAMIVDTCHEDRSEADKAALIYMKDGEKMRPMKPGTFRGLLTSGYSYLTGYIASMATVRKAS